MDVKENDPFGFMPLWCGLLDIYVDFAKICKKYGLRHYVAYGTAIGAIRHQGFIPWDDDFDVVMPREDYELFISKYYEELMQEHKLINHHNHKLFKNAFSKIMLGDRKKLTEIETATRRKQNQGVFIDIFPYDYYHCDLDENQKSKLSQKIDKIRKQKLNKKYKKRVFFRRSYKGFLI